MQHSPERPGRPANPIFSRPDALESLPTHNWRLYLHQRHLGRQRFAGPRWSRNLVLIAIALLGAALFLAGCMSSVMGVQTAIGYGEYAWEQNAFGLPRTAPLDLGLPQTATILASDDTVLARVDDRHLGARRAVKLSEISPHLVQATIAVEDRRFYAHPGVDVAGMLRAMAQNIDGVGIQGGSTLEMQVVRNLFLADERNEPTIGRKIKEASAALELDRRYTKDQILETYLNVVYYGSRAYGAEAAAETYFGKPAGDLTLAEAALLAGLPNSPTTLNPFLNPGGAKERQERILALMEELEFINRDEADEAREASLQYADGRSSIPQIAPHWVNYVQELVRERFGPDALYTAGLTIKTTLDPEVQALAERVIADGESVRRLGRANNSAMVVTDPRNGQLLAMVGSKDFNDLTIDGQVNLALAGRQPGSSIKPLVYLTGFEHGLNPAVEVDDRRTTFSAPPGQPPYTPTNFEDKFYGRTTLRDALGNSLNTPAVKVLKFIGVDTFKGMAQRLGLTTLNDWDRRWLSLTLGGGEVRLVELVGAYATIAREGSRVPIEPFLQVKTARGDVLHAADPNPAGEQIVDPRVAYQVLHVMGDTGARLVTFGPATPLNLPRPHMVKTGTTDDYRDTWTVGCLPQVCVGVWMGNTQSQPMVRVSSSLTAGKMWVDMMNALISRYQYPADAFPVPDGVVIKRIPNVGGTRPGQRDHEEVFLEGHEDRFVLDMDWTRPD